MHFARKIGYAILGSAFISTSASAAGVLETAPLTQIIYGAHPRSGGWVDFGVHAPAAQTVDLLVYDQPDAKTPVNTVALQRNASGDWGISVRGAGFGPGTFYLYRVSGQSAATTTSQTGNVLNSNFVLSDPYADQTQEVNYSQVYLSTPFVDTLTSIYAGGGKDVIYDHSADPKPTHVVISPENLVLYELHVQDYTASLASLPPQLRGTYLGLVQPGMQTPGGLTAGIDHLVELGVNAVELMPVAQYDLQTAKTPDRVNHWGYMSTNFSAPEARYASVAGAQVKELKSLVQAFHSRGIAVFADVVFNHTAEGHWVAGNKLAIKCYNVCDDSTEVYRSSNGYFVNDSGTGNDVDYSGGARFTKQLVTDSLASWYSNYGIDGFRFDLAQLLADQSTDAAAWVGTDPRYGAAHLHAEPWTPGLSPWFNFMDDGTWNYSNNRWAKWLGGFRDDARMFSASTLKDPAKLKLMLQGRGAMPGSDAQGSSKPWRSLNFVTIHDGYTMRDCTLFDDNSEANCWSSDGDESLRRVREKLMLGLLFTSAGVPLLQQGDEFGRSKSAAGQTVAANSWEWESASGDSSVAASVNWIDWGLKDGKPTTPGGATYGSELNSWTRNLIALRKRGTHFRRSEFADYATGPRSAPGNAANDGKMTYAWESPSAGSPSQLAVVWWGKPGEPDLMVIYNENWDPFTVNNLGVWSSRPWTVLAQSSLPAGQDFCTASDPTTCPPAGGSITVQGRSMAILAASRD